METEKSEIPPISEKEEGSDYKLKLAYEAGTDKSVNGDMKETAGEKPAIREKPKGLEDIVKIHSGVALWPNCSGELDLIKKMDIREDDVWVCSFPRSGTTLTQELVYLVKTLDFERANNVHLDIRFPIIELRSRRLPFYQGVKMIEKLQSPRFVKCHLHHFMLPEQLINGKGKIIYTTRNFRDTVWSGYKFTRFLNLTKDEFTFEEYLEAFLAGKVSYTPWGQHVREFWDHRNDGNILILRFEETVKDMPGTVTKIADFLSRELTDEDINKICEHCSIENMKKNEMTNFAYYKQHREAKEDHGGLINTGRGGSWQGHITEEMDRRIEELLEKHFARTGLNLSSS